MSYQVISLALLLLLSLCASLATATESDTPAFVRMALVDEPLEGIKGQERRLSVKLYSESWLRKAPRYPELEIAGALVVRPSSFATHGQETVDGREYIVQEQLYRIYPQRLGAFYVPPITLALSLAKSDQGSIRLQSNDLLFTVARSNSLPVAVDIQWQQHYRLVAGERSVSLEVGGQWDVRSGDVIERTMTMTAANTSAVFLPSFEDLRVEPLRSTSFFERPSRAAGSLAFNTDSTSLEGQQFSLTAFPGGEVYRQVSRLEDAENRGDVLALREEVWRYSLQGDGEVVLPALTFYYWNAEQDDVVELNLAGQQIELHASNGWLAYLYYGLIGLLVMVVAYLFARFFGGVDKPRLVDRVLDRFRERNAWAAVVKSVRRYSAKESPAQECCHENSRAVILMAIQQWLKLWLKLQPAAELDRLLAQPNYKLLREFIYSNYRHDEAIDNNRAAQAEFLTANYRFELLNALKSLRYQLRSAEKPITVEKNVCLPPLNP